MSSQSNSYINIMNDNILQISRIFANRKRSYGEILHWYQEAQSNLKEAMYSRDDDDITFYHELKEKISQEINSD